MRSTYYGEHFNNEETMQESEVELTGREPYAKLGHLMSVLSIVAVVFPFIIIPLSIAGIILGVLGYRSAFQKDAVRAVVIGCVMLLTGMVLTISAAMILPYSQELVDMLRSMPQ